MTFSDDYLAFPRDVVTLSAMICQRLGGARGIRCVANLDTEQLLYTQTRARGKLGDDDVSIAAYTLQLQNPRSKNAPP